MKRALIILISLLSQLSLASDYDFKSADFTQEHVKLFSVVAPEWEGYTNADGTGLYWEVLKAIYEPVGIKVKTNIIPWNRAMKMVTKYRTYNAIVGEYHDTEEPLQFPEHAIDVEYMVVLSKNTNSFTDLSSFTNKSVGWIKDYEVIPQSKRNFNLKEFRDIDQGIELLKQDQIDFLVDDWDEVAAATQKHNIPQELYTLTDMPEGKSIYVAFGDHNLSKILIDIYNKRILELLNSGELTAIYNKWEIGEIPPALMHASTK